MSTLFPLRFVLNLLAAAAAGLLLHHIAPILTPFLLSAVLACVCLPPVDWISRKLPRWLEAAIVMALLVIGLAALALLGLPRVERQSAAFLQRVLEYLGFCVLLVLPASAAFLLAGPRQLRAQYADSDFYNS